MCGSFFWWGCRGFFGGTFLFLFWRVSFPGVLGIFFFLFFYLSFVRGGLGVLDHGAGLQVCFSFPLHYVSRLDIPDFVHFVFDGPLHCRKVEQRFQTS